MNRKPQLPLTETISYILLALIECASLDFDDPG